MASFSNQPLQPLQPQPDDTITIPPLDPSNHTHTIIFLHGRGDNTRSFTNFLRCWSSSRGRTLIQTFPTIRWVFPQAPTRIVASSVRTNTNNNNGGAGAVYPPYQTMPQWFDVWTPQNFAQREEIQLPGLREMVPAVRELIRREAEDPIADPREGRGLNGRWDRVVLAGISMGSATSLHTLLNLDVPASGGGRLGAYMGFCGRCPFRGRTLGEMRGLLGVAGAPVGGENETIRRTPVLLEHNVDDPLVKIENGRDARDILVGFGAQVEWREYPSGGHWFQEPEGIDDVVNFLARAVGVVQAPETRGPGVGQYVHGS
ncbi:Alpha/Beta hydrolase protein [Dichotomopilus funicola]|uniref:Alpha/Beta hydrolase protein n=1 Tax=Dichotomopilus funicola TaxID=1934379 RepID=A0AAN6ZQ72_9PEZI|nr:Alpha/Beta hydrolase protein [Dichotomopilus funicola]